MKKTRIIGLLSALLSATLFGLTPVFANLSFAGGNNSLTLAFWRSAFAIPLLLIVLLVRKTPLRLTKREWRDMIITGIGTGTTPLLLYSSYNYISGGVATSLHFLFPILITAVGVLFFKEKTTALRVISVSLGFIGITLLSGLQAGESSLGVVLALASAATYALYMIFIQRSSLQSMDHVKLGFYIACLNSAIAAIAAFFTGSFVWDMSASAWLYSFILAITLSTIAVVLLNFAIVRIGATSAAMLSVLEPITGVILGVIILHEHLNIVQILGVIAVSISVVLVSVSDLRTKKNL